MWSAVELREVRVFLTLAEELHFGRTAERLLITPARVSQTVRTLESRVGGRLFDRTSRRVSLTPLGAQLRDAMAPAYEQMRSAFTAAQDSAAGATGVLRISMYTMVSGGPQFVEIVKTFSARNPGCRVEATDTGIVDLLAELRAGRTDMIAVRLPFTGPDVVIGPELSSEARVAVVAEDHPLADRGSVDYDDIADHPVIDHPAIPRDLVEALAPALTSNGRRIRRVVTTGRTFSELVLLVAGSDLVHLTVASFLDHHGRPGVRAVPVRDLPPSRTALVWLAGREDLRIRAFADAARQVVGDLDDPPAPRSSPGPPAVELRERQGQVQL